MLLKGTSMAPCTPYVLKVLTRNDNDNGQPHERFLTLSLFTWQAVNMKDGQRTSHQEVELMIRGYV
jgi:hypothetical protein